MPAGPIMKPEPQYRYPGVAPFSTAQSGIFFGRELEIQRLTALLSSEQQVLLYAKSGFGKSSLINAGLLPILLLQPDAMVLQIRIGAYQGPNSPSPLEAIHAALPAVPSTFLDQVIAQDGSLWQHFKAVSLAAGKRKGSDESAADGGPSVIDGSDSKPQFYLIFDQFEELFTHPKEAIFAFKKQMADLLYRVVPKQFRAVLEIKQRSHQDFLDENALQRLNEAMEFHVLYAIREDRYSLLNRLSDYLPDLLHTRFQLGPLMRAKAELAITRPAGMPEGFVTQPFRYSTLALNSILDYLTKGQEQSVETTQLQILCSRLELLRKPEIRPEDIPAFDDIFLEFYYDCIHDLPEAIRNDAQAFIEEELIKSGQRIALDRLACLEYLDADILDRLLRDRHLLRAEQNSTGGTSLELSHDTLIAPILRARTQRQRQQAENERQAREHQLREELEKLETERRLKARQLRKTRIALLTAVAGVVVAMGFFAYASEQRLEALQSEQLAKAAAERAERAEDRAQFSQGLAEESLKSYMVAEKARVDMQVRKMVEDAKGQARNGEPEIAVEYLQAALALDPDNDVVRRMILDFGAVPIVQYPPILVGSFREKWELFWVEI